MLAETFLEVIRDVILDERTWRELRFSRLHLRVEMFIQIVFLNWICYSLIDKAERSFIETLR